MADTEREAFEAWARDPIRASKLPLERWPTNGAYEDSRTYIAFYGWKSGRAALASRPAEVDDKPCDLCKGTGETQMRAAGAVWRHACARCKGKGAAPSHTTNKDGA